MSTRYNPSIIKSGLIIALDPANASSYPSGSSIIRNLNYGAQGGGTLSSPTIFDSRYGGCFNMSGVGSINCGSESIWSFSTPSFSYGAWFFFSGLNQQNGIISHRNDAPNYEQFGMSVSADMRNGGSGTNFGFFIGPDGLSDPWYSYVNYDLAPRGVGWYYGMATISTTIQSLYVNGVRVGGTATDYTGKTFNVPGRWCYIGAVNVNNSPASNWGSLLSAVHVYNKPLTAGEVFQNYNALKGRFGL